MRGFRYEYRYTTRLGESHAYILEGEKGGVHFHTRKAMHKDSGSDEYYGGLEFHSRTGEGAPNHHDCWIIGCPCWHDGTSLYAQETLIPNWLAFREWADHHERMETSLVYEYRRYFERDDD